jgi:D-alanyl-D-alanine carboxypeptidase (penicillin-binding protein 5/6)
LNFGFTGFESRLLFAEGQSIGDARLFGGESRYVPLVAAGRKAVRLMVPKNSGERILARIVYRGPVSAPVEKGKQIGVLKVWRGENVALEVPLEAAESVDEGSLTRRAFDAVGELFGGMVRAGIKKL